MKLSLSVRVAESFSNKRESTIPLEDLARIATDAGYDALCMRASVVGVHSAAGAAARVRRTVAERGLTISMVTADFPVPENSAEGPLSLRGITPSLDLAEALGADLIRICMKKEEDIVHAQRAADEARERGIRLAHQSHTRSLFETVNGSVAVLKAVGRPNFGIIYEPAKFSAVRPGVRRGNFARISALAVQRLYAEPHAGAGRSAADGHVDAGNGLVHAAAVGCARRHRFSLHLRRPAGNRL